jgi:hypothetical protein
MTKGGECTLFTLLGKEVGSWALDPGNSTIDVSGFAKGIYFIRFISGEKMMVKKLLIE